MGITQCEPSFNMSTRSSCMKNYQILDLNLHSTVYKFVNSHCDLTDRYGHCLGELQIVFASLAKHGTFIDYSCLDDA